MKALKLMLIGVLALTGTAALAAETRMSERRAAAADGLVEVSNVAGSVRVVGWRRNEVDVEGTLGKDVERVEFTSENGKTVIRVHIAREESTDERGRRTSRLHVVRDNADANLVIRVPFRSRVRVSTVSAPIHAEGLDGPLELKSVSGGVDAAGGYTEADLQSVSGTVRVRSSGRGARITAGSISGIVQVDGMNGELTGNTVSGTVRVAAGGVQRANLKSVSGDVVFDGPLAADGVYELEAISGTGRLRVEGRVNARFELHTFNGSIHNAFGPQPERTSRYAPGQELRFEEGRGGAQVRMRSISGTLHLDKK